MSTTKSINVIFDGHCGFCIRSLRVLRALDFRRRLSFHDAHQAETFDLFPVLRGADVEDAMYAVVEGEPVYRGFFSFRRLIWSNPSMWALIPLFYFPGSGFFGPKVYAWVARNRSKLGCHSEVCDLPAGLPANHLRHQGHSTRS